MLCCVRQENTPEPERPTQHHEVMKVDEPKKQKPDKKQEKKQEEDKKAKQIVKAEIQILRPADELRSYGMTDDDISQVCRLIGFEIENFEKRKKSGMDTSENEMRRVVGLDRPGVGSGTKRMVAGEDLAPKIGEEKDSEPDGCVGNFESATSTEYVQANRQLQRLTKEILDEIEESETELWENRDFEALVSTLAMLDKVPNELTDKNFSEGLPTFGKFIKTCENQDFVSVMNLSGTEIFDDRLTTLLGLHLAEKPVLKKITSELEGSQCSNTQMRKTRKRSHSEASF